MLSARWRSLSYQRALKTRLYSTAQQRIQEGDRVVLRDSRTKILSKPLRPGRVTATHWGNIEHGNVIGKQSRDTVESHIGKGVRVHLPTLEEYVLLTPRLVTPIYPADANLLVSLLDIHVTADPVHGESKSPKLEILEAGTGHGALTLYLARAIHAANRTKPYRELSVDDSPAFQEWKDSRRAILRTLDNRVAHSKHAESIARGFRQGIYVDNIDFAVGDVSEWIDQEIASRSLAPDEPFLSHIILDLPDVHQHTEKAASVLHVNGCLLTFCPSVTQIGKAVQLIREKKLPLELDRVLELGHASSGGREWDIRAVRPRALIKAEEEAKKTAGNFTSSGLESSSVDTVTDGDDAGPQTRESSGWELICRPKVGGMIIGGGFAGLWKKMKQ